MCSAKPMHCRSSLFPGSMNSSASRSISRSIKSVFYAAACDRRYQRLGDLACGTMVIFEERPLAIRHSTHHQAEALRLAELIPPDFEVSRNLYGVLSVYVDRRRRFSFGRRAEITRRLAEPLRVRFNLPPQTNGDLLLCALYQRAFFEGTGGAARFSAGRQTPAAMPRRSSHRFIFRCPLPPTEPGVAGRRIANRAAVFEPRRDRRSPPDESG